MTKTLSDRAFEIVDEIDNDDILLLYILEAYAHRHNKSKIAWARTKNGSKLITWEKGRKTKPNLDEES